VIPSSRLRRRNVHVLRSQVALELTLTLLALLASLAVVRVILLAAGLPRHAWTHSALSALTAPLVAPLAALPGGGRPLIGAATLADVTVAVLLVTVPLFMLTRELRS
jgi:hypothetical protein